MEAKTNQKVRRETPFPEVTANGSGAGLCLPEPEIAEKSPVTGANISLLDVLDAAPFYVLLVDSDHYIVEANSAVKSHLGVDREEILGKYCPRVIHGIDEPFEGCPLEEAAEKNTAIERELLDKKTGRWVLSAIYPTRAFTPAGKRIFLHVVTDITERKQAQEQLRLSHEQLRELSAHLESVREEEKRKIARDLHDETSQVLASLHAYLQAASGSLPENADKARELLEKAKVLSTRILDEVHRLIYQLRPSMLDELGLEAALNSLINETLKAAGLRVRFRITGQVRRLPAAVEISIFRIIQETFNNIMKHAHAREVKVTLTFGKNYIRASVRDDGTGFDAEKIFASRDKMHGMGLIGIRERVELLQGTFKVDSSPGCGTRVVVNLPLKDGTDHG